ncbi:hypothetical protein ACUN0C_11530 [Faunimonas sp. B44]|uniref:hypothetical protein n=1 Tax=Faunimonas sp. B44 TaxID=3461493 RepID=UPI0040446020
MSDIAFGRLQDMPPREAWRHEAHAFTPWLAANIDHLAAAIGIPLELTGQEVRVEAFAADILARNPQDDTIVLVENQLEPTDHTHLGQIMTYLAGLEAHTVVWIAPSFREPHLSAIRWLNRHTADGFAFFAVKLRVVRIGDSPYAPVFEVVEKPNGWDRQVHAARSAAEPSEIAAFRRAFWDAYAAAHPEDLELGIRPSAASSMWMPLGDVVVSAWVGKGGVGVFVRGHRGADGEETFARLAPHAAELERALQAPFGASGDALLGQERKADMSDRANWPAAIDWLHLTVHTYRRRLAERIGSQ